MDVVTETISPASNQERPLACPSPDVGGHTSKSGGDGGGPHFPEYRGVPYMIKQSAEGWFAFVDLSDGPVIVYNAVTGKPCSTFKDCVFFTRRFIKDYVKGQLERLNRQRYTKLKVMTLVEQSQ